MNTNLNVALVLWLYYFSSGNPSNRKMDDAITALEISFDDVDSISRRLVECERDDTALSLLDEDCSMMAGGIDS